MPTQAGSLSIPFVSRFGCVIKSLPIVLRIGFSLIKLGFGSPSCGLGLGLGAGQPALTMQIRSIVEGEERQETRALNPG